MPTSTRVNLIMDGYARNTLLRQAGSSQADIARQLVALGGAESFESGKTIVSKVLHDTYPTTRRRGQEMVEQVRALIAKATGRSVSSLYPAPRKGKKKP